MNEQALKIFALIFIVDVLFFIAQPEIAPSPVISDFIITNTTSQTIGLNTTTTGFIDTSSPEVTAGIQFTSVPFIGTVWNLIKRFFNFLNAPIDALERTGAPFEIVLLFGGFYYIMYIGSLIRGIFRT